MSTIKPTTLTLAASLLLALVSLLLCNALVQTVGKKRASSEDVVDNMHAGRTDGVYFSKASQAVKSPVELVHLADRGVSATNEVYKVTRTGHVKAIAFWKYVQEKRCMSQYLTRFTPMRCWSPSIPIALRKILI